MAKEAISYMKQEMEKEAFPYMQQAMGHFFLCKHTRLEIPGFSLSRDCRLYFGYYINIWKPCKESCY
jgi:hypothetical protein